MNRITAYLKTAKRYKVYHGSISKFKAFNYQNIGIANGTESGRGLYFTDDMDYAKSYAKHGYLYHVTIEIKKLLIAEKRTIKRSEIAKILKGNLDMLDNWGDVDYEGLHTVFNRAVNAYDEESNDLDLINVLGHDMYQDDWINYFKAVRKVLGYDGLITRGGRSDHYIVFNPDQVKINKVEKL